jgi:hypothetical protein
MDATFEATDFQNRIRYLSPRVANAIAQMRYQAQLLRVNLISPSLHERFSPY